MTARWEHSWREARHSSALQLLVERCEWAHRPGLSSYSRISCACYRAMLLLFQWAWGIFMTKFELRFYICWPHAEVLFSNCIQTSSPSNYCCLYVHLKWCCQEEKKNYIKIFPGAFHVDFLLTVKNTHCKLVSFFFFIPYSEAALVLKSFCSFSWWKLSVSTSFLSNGFGRFQILILEFWHNSWGVGFCGPDRRLI